MVNRHAILCNTEQKCGNVYWCITFSPSMDKASHFIHMRVSLQRHILLCFIQLVGGWQEITEDHSKTPKLLDPKCHKYSFQTLLSPGSAQTCCSQWRRPWTGLTWLSLDPGETLSTHCPAAHNWWGNLFEGLMLESCGQNIMLKWACNIIDLVDARKCAECKSNVIQLKRKKTVICQVVNLFIPVMDCFDWQWKLGQLQMQIFKN